VIYNYEWAADAPRLTVSGQEHVGQIAHSLCQTPFPVVIEPTYDRRVDELRRAAVLEALANDGSPTNPDRVIFARPEAEGLYGDEARGVARGMFTSQSGVQGGAAGGGGLGGGTALGGTQGSAGTSPSVGVGVGFY
jgi:hypothetical protein